MTETGAPSHEEQIEAGLTEWTKEVKTQHKNASMTTRYIGLESVRFKLFEIMQGHRSSAESPVSSQKVRQYHHGQAEGLELALRILTTNAVILPEDVTESFKSNADYTTTD